MQIREILSRYLHGYFEEVDRLGYGDLRRRQRSLFASLAFGAAGIAYTQWYAGHVLNEPERFETANRWINSALRAQHGLLAFVGPGEGTMPSCAVLYGRAGLHFVHALIANAKGARRTQYAAIRRFLEVSRPSRNDPPDLFKGTAGSLAGAAILLRHTGDPRLLEAGAFLSHHLTRELGRQGGSRVASNLGLAHGTAGLYLSLLLWMEATGTDLAQQVSCGVRDLLDSVLREPVRLSPKEGDVYSWLCNGFAGMALLAVKAHQILKDPWFLSAAQRAAELSLAHPARLPDACCGRAGTAFACLALARQDPQGLWRKRAEELALSALLVDREDWRFTGLYGGEAGLACLALNLLAGIPSGLPCLDLIEWPRK
ncbi:MAG TPA: lanthionine synthetase LanC family protein [Thermoanaerobaculia bacterium]|nr:lanthionine synthetase LanC family protein [Thermoanaerobaculia bacterium]